MKEPTAGEMIVMTHTGLYATEQDRDRMAARIDDALAFARAEGVREGLEQALHAVSTLPAYSLELERAHKAIRAKLEGK